MAANKIVYPDKVTNTPSPLPEQNKWTGPNGTEVKNVVNSHADDIDALQLGTENNSYKIGDGGAGNKEFIADNGDANLPRLRFNDTSNKWEFSNDGLTFDEIGGGSGVSLQAWNFDIATADADPGSGEVRLNDADLTLVTFLYISNENAQGLDVSEIINDLAVGSNIGIQQSSNIAKAALYDITGAIVDGGTYKKIPVVFKSQGGGGLFDDTELLVFSLIPVGGGVVGTNEPERIDFDANLDTSYQTQYLTPIQISDIASNGITGVTYSAAPDDGNFDFAGNVENDSLVNLNIYLDGLADALWVVVRTDVVLTRESSIRRIKNLD